MNLLLPLFTGLFCGTKSPNESTRLMSLVASVLAQSQFCSPNGICVALSVPTAHIASGNPDLLITLQAPSSDKWFAIGFGNKMAGTLMVVVWPDNDKVVASVRLAVSSPAFTGS